MQNYLFALVCFILSNNEKHHHSNLYFFSRGFYPRGQGEVSLEVKPILKPLKPVDITDFGELVSVQGIAYVAGALPIKVVTA